MPVRHNRKFGKHATVRPDLVKQAIDKFTSEIDKIANRTFCETLLKEMLTAEVAEDELSAEMTRNITEIINGIYIGRGELKLTKRQFNAYCNGIDAYYMQKYHEIVLLGQEVIRDISKAENLPTLLMKIAFEPHEIIIPPTLIEFVPETFTSLKNFFFTFTYTLPTTNLVSKKYLQPKIQSGLNNYIPEISIIRRYSYSPTEKIQIWNPGISNLKFSWSHNKANYKISLSIPPVCCSPQGK